MQRKGVGEREGSEGDGIDGAEQTIGAGQKRRRCCGRRTRPASLTKPRDSRGVTFGERAAVTAAVAGKAAAAEALGKQKEAVTCVKHVFCLPDALELKFLKKEWASMRSVATNLKKGCGAMCRCKPRQASKEFSRLWEQPIHQVRNYYGEQIALVCNPFL